MKDVELLAPAGDIEKLKNGNYLWGGCSLFSWRIIWFKKSIQKFYC